MIELIDIPTEQTTAATNLVLTVLALSYVFYLHRVESHAAKKKNIWSWFFGLIALTGILGTVVHGLKISEATSYFFWRLLYLTLGLEVSLLMIGLIYDVTGYIASRTLAIILTIGVSFFTVTLLIPDSFLVFIIYEALALLFAISTYSWLAITRKLAYAWLMAIGLLISIIAAGIQASEAVEIQLIWQFDHNGIFHIVQAIGLLFIMVGLRFSFETVPLERQKKHK